MISSSLAPSVVRPWRNSIGSWVKVNRKLKGKNTHSLAASQSPKLSVMRKVSLSAARARKNTPQFRESLSHPSSVDTIPTSANQEDHVSMGATSALWLRTAVDRAEHVLAIEALCAAQGLDFHGPRPGAGVAAAHRLVRDRVPHLDADRSPAPDIEAIRALVHGGDLLATGATQTAHA